MNMQGPFSTLLAAGPSIGTRRGRGPRARRAVQAELKGALRCSGTSLSSYGSVFAKYKKE